MLLQLYVDGEPKKISCSLFLHEGYREEKLTILYQMDPQGFT